MTTSIVKSSKSIFVKILVGIIILPFVFWGMGDVFRGGNQNVVATIDSNKISTQEFVNYVKRLNLDENQIDNLRKTDLLEKILSEYIGKKVFELEIQNQGIVVSDNSLRNIITNDKLFFKKEKFSRTEYEKFLLTSGVTAPAFEKNIAKQESRRQFLSYLSGGIIIPEEIIKKEFRKENQIKTIKYIDLNKYYLNKKPSKEKIEQLYKKNKNLFTKELKSFQYAEITPQLISGGKEYNESFFRQLDIIENKVLDGQSLEKASQENNLKINIFKDIDKNKTNTKNEKLEKISDELFKIIFAFKNEKSPEIIKIANKYYLAEVISINQINLTLKDSSVNDAIINQLNFQNKVESNTSLIKDISMDAFNEAKMYEFASKNNLEVKNYKVSSLKQNDIFSEGIIKRIYLTKNGDIDLITDSTLTKNFLILATKTDFKKIDNNSNEFEQYKAKAKLNLINKIYESFDNSLNKKYKVELNKRTIERVKNSF